MTRNRLYLFDTTLRDGQQTPGVDFSLEDKLLVMSMLDKLGVDYIEGGYPGGNPTDTALFETERRTRATFTAFGMTKRAGRSVSNDAGLQTLLQAKSKAVCFVAKSWDYHVRVALGCSNEENLESIRESVAAAKAAGKEVLVDCEHFFDGYKANADYALACAKTAYEAGARWVVLCDTNGGTLPAEVSEIVRTMTNTVPGSHLGIHAHNDTEQAVANSLAAIDAGARQIQGTLNGIGERCGNANLVSLIGTLCTKPAYRDRFETGVDEARLQELTTVSRGFDELLNRSPYAQAPYVGKSAFATKAGIHASALAKEPETYEHVPPETVGNRRRILVSDQAGKSNLLAELSRVGMKVEKDDRRLDALLAEVKQREAEGYAYDGADASFELLARRALGGVPHFFDVLSFRTSVEKFNGDMHTEAVVKVKVGNDIYLNAGEGNGPVNALDVALRKDLGKFQKHIADMELVDFKVRILNGGTGATTRVLIESRDGAGERWFTVGVSPNIVEASFQALQDAIIYKLVRDGVAA
jgi:2-isopropylmalate synthase